MSKRAILLCVLASITTTALFAQTPTPTTSSTSAYRELTPANATAYAAIAEDLLDQVSVTRELPDLLSMSPDQKAAFDRPLADYHQRVTQILADLRQNRVAATVDLFAVPKAMLNSAFSQATAQLPPATGKAIRDRFDSGQMQAWASLRQYQRKIPQLITLTPEQSTQLQTLLTRHESTINRDPFPGRSQFQTQLTTEILALLTAPQQKDLQTRYPNAFGK